MYGYANNSSCSVVLWLLVWFGFYSCIFSSFDFQCSLFFFQNPNPEKENPPCNAQELEECDAFLEDGASLCRFDGNTLKVTHIVSTNYCRNTLKQFFFGI